MTPPNFTETAGGCDGRFIEIGQGHRERARRGRGRDRGLDVDSEERGSRRHGQCRADRACGDTDLFGVARGKYHVVLEKPAIGFVAARRDRCGTRAEHLDDAAVVLDDDIDAHDVGRGIGSNRNRHRANRPLRDPIVGRRWIEAASTAVVSNRPITRIAIAMPMWVVVLILIWGLLRRDDLR